ncbi:Multiprotein-bridging factor 1 [Smittium mucronatum]|uniref:Multiprotein-bridging factor 1 n=1 Tax=Smittium mucronatum TaxID=133383 RepID=A0A1R0H8V5_9FUNG|nr:Multiprotein-bridging factor 1 [Smittium mucronatum]
MSNVGWDDVTILRKSANRPKVAKSESVVNAAKRSGIEVVTERKSTIANKANHHDTDHQRIAKLDREDLVTPPPKVDLSVGKAMQQARMAKSLSQKELGVKVNERQTVINDYEAGRAIPNQQILGKLERALGVKLRGKNIGEPLFQKK